MYGGMISCPGMAFGRSRLWQTRLHSAPGLSFAGWGRGLPEHWRQLCPGSNFLWPLPPLLLPCPLILPEAARGVPLSLNAPTRATFTGLPPDGSSTVIGTWSLADAVDNLSSDGMHVSIDLNMGDASYDSYGLIFNAYKSGSQSGGMAASITNLQISGEMVPEPATASLGLIGLAAMLMRRRRG